MVFCYIEDAPGEALAKPTILLDPELRWGLEFHRQDEPGDAGDPISPTESSDQLHQPIAISDYIIIGKRQNLAPGCHHAAIACPRRTWTVFAYIAHLRHIPVGLLDEIRRGTGTGSVIDDNNLIAGIVQGQQRLQTALYALWAVTGGHDDAHKGSLSQKLLALLNTSRCAGTGQACYIQPRHWRQTVL